MQIDNLYLSQNSNRLNDLIYKYDDIVTDKKIIYDASTLALKNFNPSDVLIKIDDFIVTDVRYLLYLFILTNIDTLENIYIVVQESQQEFGRILSVINKEYIDLSINSYILLDIIPFKHPSNINIIDTELINTLKNIFETARQTKTNISLRHLGKLLDMDIPPHLSIPNDDYSAFSFIHTWKLDFLSHFNFYFRKMYNLIEQKEKRDLKSKIVLYINPIPTVQQQTGLENLMRLPSQSTFQPSLERIETVQPTFQQSQFIQPNQLLQSSGRIEPVQPTFQQPQFIQPTFQQSQQNFNQERIIEPSFPVSSNPLKSEYELMPLTTSTVPVQLSNAEIEMKIHNEPYKTGIHNKIVPFNLQLLLRIKIYQKMLANYNKFQHQQLSLPKNSYYFSLGNSPSEGISLIVKDKNGTISIIKYLSDETRWIKSTDISSNLLTLQDIVYSEALENYQEIYSTRSNFYNIKKCFVFDFDCTFTYSHFYYLLFERDSIKYRERFGNVLKQFGYENYSDSELKRIANTKSFQSDTYEKFVNIIYGGQNRLKILVFFLNFLKKMGYDLYISSHGACGAILENLKAVNLHHFFKTINARGTGDCWKGTKDVFVENLVKEGYHTIVYVDDDNSYDSKIRLKIPSNVRYNFYGQNIGLRKEGNGLDRRMMTFLLDEAYNLATEN